MSEPWAEVIGDPIAHSKSPLIHGFWLDGLGLPGRYTRMRVPTGALSAFLDERRRDPDWRGCNVTVPLKERIVPLLDRLSPEAARIGAVNTVVREGDALVGHNTDAGGFLDPLRPLPPRDRGGYCGSAIVIGSGGAARAIVSALFHEGFMVGLLARSTKKAGAIADAIGEVMIDVGPLTPHVLFEVMGEPREELNVLVNATSLGMVGQPPLEVSLARVSPCVTIYDIVYAPLETPLLREARKRGHPTIDGLAMLVGQAAEAFRLFFGVAPPRERDAELRERLLA